MQINTEKFKNDISSLAKLNIYSGLLLSSALSSISQKCYVISSQNELSNLSTDNNNNGGDIALVSSQIDNGQIERVPYCWDEETNSWIAIANSYGKQINELSSALTSQQSLDVLSNYLPLSGGSISGDLEVQKNNFAVLSGKVNFGSLDNYVRDINSFAFGRQVSAYGSNSIAAGLRSSLTGDYACVVGLDCLGNGTAIHVEGSRNDLIGNSSHAEGSDNKLNGIRAHIEGSNNVISNDYEHAQGRLNVSHKANGTFGNSGNTIHSIGIGLSANENDVTHRNAIEVMQNGDVYVISVGGYDGTSIDNATTLQSTMSSISSDMHNKFANLSSNTAISSFCETIENNGLESVEINQAISAMYELLKALMA